MSDEKKETHIRNRVAGDNWTIRLTVVDIPVGQTLAQAWFTVKRNLDDLDSAAIVQKIITSAPAADGQIEDTGSDGTGVIKFTLAPEDTELFDHHVVYVWDAQVETNIGIINTPDYARGTLKAEPQITQSS